MMIWVAGIESFPLCRNTGWGAFLFDRSDFTFPVPRGKMGVDEQHRQSQLQVPKGRR